MERLTHFDKDGWYITDQSAAYDGRRRGEEINLLAKYEDTGLTPEEIQGLFKMDGSNIMKKALRWKEAEAEGRLIVLPEKSKRAIIRDGMYYTFSDFTPEEVSSLLEAWDAGLLVVLPCKPGSIVKCKEEPKLKTKVDAITIYEDGRITFSFHNRGVKQTYVDEWTEDDAKDYIVCDE